MSEVCRSCRFHAKNANLRKLLSHAFLYTDVSDNTGPHLSYWVRMDLFVKRSDECLQKKFHENPVNSDVNSKTFGSFSCSWAYVHLCIRRLSIVNLDTTIHRTSLQENWFRTEKAPCHMSKQVKKFFSKNQMNIQEWPGTSPHLNPIENLRSIC